MKPLRLTALALFLTAATSFAAAPSPVPQARRPSRTFLFNYHITLTNLPPNEPLRIWLPVAPTNTDQQVRILTMPEDAQLTYGKKYDNIFMYLSRPAPAGGSLDLAVTYQITRYQVTEDPTDLAASQHFRDQLFLSADAHVPVGGKAMSLLAGRSLPTDQLALGHLLYDVVDDHMQYRKDKPGWGTGDADWACSSGYGNCTDFHSLFIALARGNHMPARFQIGFPLDPMPAPGEHSVAGYHCWAEFKPAGHPWIPVDISEANQHPELRAHNFGTLSPDRVMFSMGRDLTLSPPQHGAPINFFVYPYVEVNNQPLPQTQIARHFSYTDVPATTADRN